MNRHHNPMTKRRHSYGILALAFLILCCPALFAGQGRSSEADLHEGVIIRVVSAGELVLWEKGTLYPFTLYGIVLPEPDSPRGKAAKKTVSDMIFNTLLTVRFIADQGEKNTGIVFIRGTCLNESLIRSGLARLADTCTMDTFCKNWEKAADAAEKGKAGTGAASN